MLLNNFYTFTIFKIKIKNFLRVWMCSFYRNCFFPISKNFFN